MPTNTKLNQEALDAIDTWRMANEELLAVLHRGKAKCAEIAYWVETAEMHVMEVFE